MKSLYLAGLVLLLSFVVFAYPFRTSAQLPGLPSLAPTLPFGGRVTIGVPCTCPESLGRVLITFAPFFTTGLNRFSLGGSSLTYVPGSSQLYAHYQIGVPSTWHLGTYTPTP